MTDPARGNGFYTNRPMMVLNCGHIHPYPGHGHHQIECAVCHQVRMYVWRHGAWQVSE